MMAEGKYTKIGGAVKQIVGEYTKVGGAIKAGTINAPKIGGDIKEISVAEKRIWSGERDSDRLYGINDEQDVLDGWPLYGDGIADPSDVACDSDGNSYWACADDVRKYDATGSLIWKVSKVIGYPVAAPVVSICVDADGYVYCGDGVGVVRKIDPTINDDDPESQGYGERLVLWTKQPYVGAVNALAIDYSAGQLYAAYGVDANGRIYRFLASTGNGASVYYLAGANLYSIAVDEVLPSLYIGDQNGWLRKISTAGYVYWTVSKGGEIYAVRVGHDGYGYYINGSQGDVGKFALSDGGGIWTDEPAGTVRGLAVDRSGNVYSCHGAYGSVNAVIRKNNSDGDEQWTWQPYVNSEWRGLAVSPGIKAAGFD